MSTFCTKLLLNVLHHSASLCYESLKWIWASHLWERRTYQRKRTHLLVELYYAHNGKHPRAAGRQSFVVRKAQPLQNLSFLKLVAAPNLLVRHIISDCIAVSQALAIIGFESRHLKHPQITKKISRFLKENTYLSARELLQESLGLVGLAEHEVRGHFDVRVGILCGYECLVGTKVFGVRVECLQQITAPD